MTSQTQPTAVAIVVAAGNSTRMGRGAGDSARKPLLEIGGRTLLEHACAAFDAVPSVREIVVVAHPDDVARVRGLGSHSGALAKVRAVVAGGAQRTDSVRAGVDAASREFEIVLVHDAARPLVSPAVIERAIEVAARDGAALVAIPVRDTLKNAPDGARAMSTVDRSTLWAAQTPQAFRGAVLRDLLARAAAESWVPTDDAALYERYVGPITLVPGEATNLKITTPEDLVLASAILAQRVKEQKQR
jgi:2-C-methyl-D-erythritol 4-phosphate cytidylyltransferase